MKPNSPPAQNEQNLEVFVTTWRAIRKHWLLAVGTALVVFLAVTFYTLGQKKIYRATGTLQFDPRPPQPLGRDIQTVVDMGAGDYWNNREYYETQYHVISSNSTALGVVEELGLNTDPAFIHNAPPNAKLPAEEIEPLEAAKLLRGRLSVDPVKDSRLARITYEDANPERAQLIVSTLMHTYTAQNLQSTLKSTDAAVEWLTTQMAKLKGDLETSEMALHEYKQSNNILSVSLDDRSSMLREELTQLSEALTRARAARTRASSRTRQMRKVGSSDPRSLPASELLSNPLLSSLRQRYEDTVRDRDAQLGMGKGENHNDVREAKARVDAAKAALSAEIKNHKKASRGDLSAISQEVGGLSSLLKDAEKRAHKLNLLEIEYNRLRRARDNNEKLYSMLLDRTKETDLQRMLRVNNIHVLDEPEMPAAPVRPRVPLMLLLGALCGLGLGMATCGCPRHGGSQHQDPRRCRTRVGRTVPRSSAFIRAARRTRPELRRAQTQAWTTAACRVSRRDDRARGADQFDRRGRPCRAHQLDVHVAGQTVRAHADHQRTPRRRKNHRRVLHCHRHRASRQERAAHRLRPAATAYPPHLRQVVFSRSQHSPHRPGGDNR